MEFLPRGALIGSEHGSMRLGDSHSIGLLRSVLSD